MKYFDYLELNKNYIVKQLEILFTEYKVQPVGNGYIDCIVIKSKMDEFIRKVGELGILIYVVNWWCYVDPNESANSGCPHGLGGPKSEYFEGWFSELQNDFIKVDDASIKRITENYDKDSVYELNMKTSIEILKILKTPFRYTPHDYIAENKCVTPSLWLLVPDSWKRL